MPFIAQQPARELLGQSEQSSSNLRTLACQALGVPDSKNHIAQTWPEYRVFWCVARREKGRQTGREYTDRACSAS